MKKGIRLDQSNKKIRSSKRIYDCIATEQVNGRVLELHKTYVYLDIFSDNGYLTTSTEYKCPFCNMKEKTDTHTKTNNQGKTIIEIHCKSCKKLLMSETLNKNEL